MEKHPPSFVLLSQRKQLIIHNNILEVPNFSFRSIECLSRVSLGKKYKWELILPQKILNTHESNWFIKIILKNFMRQDTLLLLLLATALLVHGQDLGTLINTSENFDSATPTPITTIDATSLAPANLRTQNQQTTGTPAQPQGPAAAATTQAQPQQQPQQQQQQFPQAPPASQQANIPAPVQPVTPNQSPSQPTFPQAQSQTNQASGTIEQPKILLTQVQHPIVSKGFKIDQGISYQRIKVGQLKKKYLFFNFKLSEKDKWQQVNITITNQGTNIILNKCTYRGIDDCFVPSFALKAESVLFIHVQCQDDCSYNLNAQWSDTQHLIPGNQVIFMFGKDTTQIYHVELQNQDDFEEVRIHLAPRVTRKPFDNIKIYGKYGSDLAPTPDQYDFKSINLWEDGQGIFLKKSTLKEKKFILLIVGQTETTYRLSMELVQQSTHQISNGQHIYEYLQAKSEKIYHVKSIPDAFDEYSLRFSVLSGSELDIGYFTDKQLKKKLDLQPFEYMKDSEFILDTNLLDPKKDGLYVRVKTQSRDATYTIKFVGRSKTEAIELSQNVYGFIQVKNQSKFAHFDFKRWVEQTEVSSKLKFTVYIIEAAGKVTAQFFVCQSTLSLCTNPQFYKNTTTAISVKTMSEVSQKQVYQLVIQDKVLRKINIAEQQTTIIVKLNPNNINPLDFNLAAIQFVNNNKVLYLRQGRPLQQKMAEKEMKIYKYINSDPNVQEIRIHINQISGQVIFSGFIQTTDPSKPIPVFPEAYTLRFTNNLTLPIYVSVNAQTKSIFGISMQVIHKSQINKNINIATISQDVGYTVKIHPNSFAIYEVVPIFYDFFFSYSASQSVIVCPLNPETNTCIDPKGEPTANPNLSTKGEITNAILKDRKALIKITNPFSESIAQVSFIFHSRKFDHCDDRKIGQAFQQTVKDGSCISYPLQSQDKTIDLYISKRQFGSLTYHVLICGNLLANATQVKTLEIIPQVIELLCRNSQNKKIAIIWTVATKNVDKQQKSVKVDLLAQYRGEVVVLSQGVSYNRIVKVQQNPVGKFAYNLINKKDTKIILSQIRGRFKVFAKLVQQSYRDTDTISNINYHFASSQTVDYSQQPTIIIRQKDLQKQWCIDCSILIVVYSEEQRGYQVQFDIQIVQRYYVLNQDTAIQGYLDTDSFAYYTFTARSENNQNYSTILFLISDHNQQCANMYLSVIQNPGPTNNIAKSIRQNQLIFRHFGKEKKYYLSVQALDTCDYTLSVLTYYSSIHNIKRGKQNLIKIPKGIIKYFSLDHYTNQPFKLISLNKYGQINIYINQSSLTVDRKSFRQSELELKKFAYKSEHSNTLTIDQKHPVFCQKCTYFIAIEALTNTEATLYLVYPQTTITLTQGHFLSDYLAKKGDYTLATYNRVQNTLLNVKVFSGTLNITAFYKQQTIGQSFNAKNGIQNFTINLQSSSEPTKPAIPQADPNLGTKPSQPLPAPPAERIPINFLISAISDDVSYTLQLKSLAGNSNINQLTTYQTLIAGEPNSIKITSSKPVCLTGFLRDSNESLILSVNNDNNGLFNELVMQATIEGDTAEITKTKFKNIMGIDLKRKDKKDEQRKYVGSPYQLCLKLADKIAPSTKDHTGDSVTEVENEQPEETIYSASITQANTVNILPSDIESVVKGQSIFVIHSEGAFLLDIFQCQDQAKMIYGKSLQKIQKQKLKGLDSYNMNGQRHAIPISQEQTTFIKINSKHSVIKWIPINQETEQGLGYKKLQIGDLRYFSKFKELIVEYQPLQQNKPYKAQIKEVTYNLYISNITKEIQYASQCATPDPFVMVVPLDSPNLNQFTQRQYLSKTIEKQVLEKNFPNSENIYINVVCDLSLTVPLKPNTTKLSADEHEHYRFLYSRQQVPLGYYQQNQLQSIPYHYLILLLFCIAAVLLLCTYLFTRKIVPMLARLRSSNLVEQQVEKQHKDDLEVPASSDRNQRAPDIAVEAEDKPQK